jgi:hypothetical protein
MFTYSKEYICIYIDLENIYENLNLKKIMRDIILKYEAREQSSKLFFAYKIACGNSASISKYREQLENLNFEIRETPHLTSKESKSALIISLDSFDKLHLSNPTINGYVFLTNNPDLGIIMDILGKHGIDVVLVTAKGDNNKEIFNNCSAIILSMNDYLEIQNKNVSNDDNDMKNTKKG